MTERESFVKQAAKKYSKGRFTATQTGARQLAERRRSGQLLHEVAESVENAEDFEAQISGKKRPTRTKR